jgi:hypothetical protein
MAMPPKIQPSELWLQLIARPRPTTTVEFPTRSGTVGKVKIWILNEEELHGCRKDARDEAVSRIGSDPKGDTAFEDIYRNELVIQLLCRACRAVEDPQHVPAFPTPSIARKVLLTDEWAVLFDAYNKYRAESGPMISEMTVPEMNAWIRELQEGGSRVPLARMSSEGLTDLVMHLVALHTNSSTGNGSAGSQPDESSPTETTDASSQ